MAETLRRGKPSVLHKEIFYLLAHASGQSICRSDEPCGARMRDCNTYGGLVSNGNEIIERFRQAYRRLGAFYYSYVALAMVNLQEARSALIWKI